MIEKNQKIYFDSVPDMKSIPKIEKIMKANPIIMPEDLHKLEGTRSVLDALVPKEVKGMVEAFKAQMMQFIGQNLDRFENDGKITEFLHSMNLPFSLDTVMNTCDISDSLWRKISDIQQRGAALYISNQLMNINKRGEEVLKRVSDMEVVVKVR